MMSQWEPWNLGSKTDSESFARTRRISSSKPPCDHKRKLRS